MLLLHVCVSSRGLFAGYFSSRLCRTLKGESRKGNTIQTAPIFPLILGSCVLD